MASTEDDGSRNLGVRVRGEDGFSPGPTGTPSLSDDDKFKVLSNRRRRQVISYLREAGGAATVSELAEHIAAEETGTPITQLSSYERKRVYISLYQNHLPVMDDANVVDYDANRKTVQLEETAIQLEPYLEDAPKPGESWMLACAALAVAAGVLLGSSQVGPFATASISVWTLIGIVGLIGVSSFKLVDTAVA